MGLDIRQQEVVSAFVWPEVVEKLADAAPKGFDCALGRLAEQGLELGEGHLDRIEVRRVRRQQEDLCAGGADGGSDLGGVPGRARPSTTKARLP